MNKYIYGFIGDKLKTGIFGALIISGVFAFVDFRYVFNYLLGFLIGCTNFIGLSLGADYLLSVKPKRAGIVHFMFFTLRYVVVAYLIAQIVTEKGGNPLIIVLGFLTLNLSIKYSAFREYLSAKKEG